MVKGALVLAISLFAAADDQKKDDVGAGKGLKELQGKWKVTAGEEGGKKLEAVALKEAMMTITGNRIRVKTARDKREMTFAIKDTGQKKGKGKAIDFTILSGPDKGKVSRGIYLLDGDTLKIAYAPPGKERPKDFTTKDSKAMMWVMERAGR